VIQAFVQESWHWPDHSKNLKVLSGKTTGEELKKEMVGFSKGLGVRCYFCHVGEEGKPFSTFDFAVDTKHEKLMARKMMKMVNDLNKKYLGRMEDADIEKITCVTCHMGKIKPTISADSLLKK
jgi:hypothetical protein